MLTMTGRRPVRGDNPKSLLKDGLQEKVVRFLGQIGQGKLRILFQVPEIFKKTVQGTIDWVEAGKDGCERRKVKDIRRGTGLSND